MRRGARSLLSLLALALAGLVQTHPARAVDLPAGFAQLRAQDAELQRIGYRLVTGNAAFCPRTAPATGLLLHDLATYDSSLATTLRERLGLAGPIGVEAVVPGSPAAQAGIALDDTLLAINDRPVADFALEPERPWRRVVQIHKSIESALRDAKTVRLTLDRGGVQRTVTLGATPACATRFEVVAMGGKAAAEGERVVIGEKFPGFGYSEEEFAAALAHELAHNILRHRAVLNQIGRSADNVRETERQADRMMPWLLANAGYDPEAAPRFMRRYGPGHGDGIFSDGTHDRWGKRAEALALEAQLVAMTRQLTGAADWRPRMAAALARAAAAPAIDRSGE